MKEKMKMADLGRQLAAEPGTDVNLTTWTTGAAILDVRRGGHLFVMAYFPKEKCFGVDEVGDHDGFLTSYRFTSGTFEEAADHLRALVSSPSQQPPGTPTFPSPEHPTLAEGEAHRL